MREVPEDWRKENITHFFKKSKKEDPENYRLVSLTSSTGKVTEHEQEINRSSQCGFTKGKSYLTNLINFCDEMTGLVDEGRAVDIVYLDFRKAFDTISHRQGVEVWAG